MTSHEPAIEFSYKIWLVTVIKSFSYFNIASRCLGRKITFIVDFDVVGRSGVSKLPPPKSMEDLENSTDEDAFAECCPWLDLSRCH